MASEVIVRELRNRANVLGLEGVAAINKLTDAQLAADYNGIGPEWMPAKWRETLDKTFADFAPACLIHDCRWAHSNGTEEAFTASNSELGANCRKLADAAYPWYSLKRYIRRHEAEIFQSVCQAFGKPAYNEAYYKANAKPRTEP